MSFVYGGYNPKAPNGSSGSSQAPTTSATGRKFAVMPKLGSLGGLGGLGYSKPPPKPAAASQVPLAPSAASPTPSTAAAASNAAAADSAQPAACASSASHPSSSASRKATSSSAASTASGCDEQFRSQQQKNQSRPQLSQHRAAHTTQAMNAVDRPSAPVGTHNAAGGRVLFPVVKTNGTARFDDRMGYGAQVRKPPVMPSYRIGLGYGAGSSLDSNLSLNIPLREPTPEPVMVEQKVETVKEEYKIEDDYKVYGTVEDIEIQVRNVVCNYTLPLHIDLRRLAQHSNNVTFDRGRGVLLKQKRNPMCYVKIYSSGKVYIVGCRSEEDCMIAARRIARNVQRAMNKLGEEVRIRNYRVCNVLATCKVPFGVKIEEVAGAYPSEALYEPEMSVGLVWRNKEPKATLRIHTTGSVTVTGAQSEADVYRVIERLYPILLKYKCPPRAKGEISEAAKRRREIQSASRKRSPPPLYSSYGGPRAKKSRGEASSGGGTVIGGRVVFSDEEDEDDIYDPAFYDE